MIQTVTLIQAMLCMKVNRMITVIFFASFFTSRRGAYKIAFLGVSGMNAFSGMFSEVY